MVASAQTMAAPARMLKAKASPGPPNGSRIAANAGPTNWAALNVEELRAIAVGISARGTRLGMSASRTGCQKEKVMPRASAIASSSQIVMRPANVVTVSNTEITTSIACVAVAIFRRSMRSAITPPIGPNSSTGSASAAATAPTQKPEWVSSQASQLIEIRTTQVPTTFGICPMR